MTIYSIADNPPPSSKDYVKKPLELRPTQLAIQSLYRHIHRMQAEQVTAFTYDRHDAIVEAYVRIAKLQGDNA